jgi:hypothetical protein
MVTDEQDELDDEIDEEAMLEVVRFAFRGRLAHSRDAGEGDDEESMGPLAPGLDALDDEDLDFGPNTSERDCNTFLFPMSL